VRDIVWSNDALDDMDALAAYIAADNPSAALNVVDRMDQTVGNLSHMPTGRRGRVKGTYEKPVTGLPYIIAYALQRRLDGGERLVVLRVIHCARDWREGEWPD
jgi:toxin ParE1/3/4